MTLDARELEALAVQVRGLVDRVARLFGAAAEGAPAAVDTPVTDAYTAGASQQVGWSHLVRVPVPADAEDRLDGPVRTLLTDEGFEEVDRSTATEIARQFRRPGVDVGVQIARSGKGDVVIGAGTSA